MNRTILTRSSKQMRLRRVPLYITDRFGTWLESGLAAVEASAAVPEFDGGVLGSGEEEVFVDRVPVDAVDGAWVGSNDTFLRSAPVTGDVPQNDVTVAGAAGQDVPRGFFEAPFDVVDAKIDFVGDFAGEAQVFFFDEAVGGDVDDFQHLGTTNCGYEGCAWVAGDGHTIEWLPQVEVGHRGATAWERGLRQDGGVVI